MRLLFICGSLGPGGAERMLAELANACTESGMAVGVLTISREYSDHYELSLAVERVALDIIWDANTMWQTIYGNFRRSRMIRGAVNQFRPDVVVSFIEQTNVRVLAALLGAGIPVVVSERIDPRRHVVGLGWRCARRLLYPLAKRVVVQTQSVAAGWARQVTLPSRIVVIPNFVGAMANVPVDIVRESAVLAVGRLDPQKGFDILLRAFAGSGLARQGGRLVILGEGSERRNLEELARSLGIEQATSMPGIVKDPEQWMARCSIFVVSSRYEGFPNVLLEAMAMGCAVISTDCDSGPGEIIHDGQDGILVPPEDVGALTRALMTLSADADLRRRLATAATSVRVRFAKKSIVERWTLMLEQLGR